MAVAVGVVIGGGSATAAPKAVPTASSESFSALAQVTTSTRQRLGLFIGASRSEGVGAAGTFFDVTLNKKTGAESHTWGFPVPNSAFTVGSNGKGKVSVRAVNLAPFGVVKLSFTPAAKAKKQRCNSSAYVLNQKVKVSGLFYFDSRSTGKHKWGHYGNKHKRMTFKAGGNVVRSFGQTGVGCAGPSSQPCAKTLTWFASNHDNSVTLGGGALSKKRGYISGSGFVTLSKPKKATRSDFVEATVPAPKLKKGSGGSATMSVSTSGGIARGSGKLTSKTPGSSFSEPCGKGKSQTSEFWQSALKNAKPALEMTPDIFGPIKLRNGSTGAIDTTSG